MYRRWLVMGLAPLLAPGVAAAQPKPAQFNATANSDLVRIADLLRAKTVVEQLPPERRAAALASLETEIRVVAQRVAASLGVF